MNAKRTLVLLLAVVVAEIPCAAQKQSVLVRAPGTVNPSRGWQAIWFPELDDVIRVLGLQPLRTQPRDGESAREVRVWIAGAMGYPRHLYRVRIENGAAQGQLFHYWRKADSGSVADSVGYDQIVRRQLRGLCGPITSGPTLEVCPGTHTPDWGSILANAESAGLWILPDEDSLPSRVGGTDGWSMVVELRAGSEYRTYKYHSPSPQISPESGRAFQISRSFFLARPERHRGPR